LIGCFLASIAACAGETAPLQQQQQNDVPDASTLDARGDEQQQQSKPDASAKKVVAEGEVSGKTLDAQSAFYFAQKVTLTPTRAQATPRPTRARRRPCTAPSRSS
jgi:hypothetical protein